MFLNEARLRELFTKKGRTYPHGSIIFLENEQAKEMYIIVSGKVQITKSYKEMEIFGGSRLTIGSVTEKLATLQPGDFFGEMALLNDVKRMASANAEGTVEVIVLTRDDLSSLMKRSPEVAVQMMKSICDRLRATEESPRAETILPKVQEFIQAMRSQGRSIKGIHMEEEPPSAPPAKRRGTPATPTPTVPQDAAPAKKCEKCDRLARPDDNFCGRCGHKLA